MGLSWSAIRRVLEQENICESLKGRIQYFATRYKKSHDQEGRVAIRIDGEEVFKSCFYDWNNKRVQSRENITVPDRETINFTQYWNLVHNETKNFAGFDQHYFYEAFYIYHNSSIDDSLASPDPVVRLFAILDKRIGRRRLQKILSEIEQQPEWLQVFYRLRLETDGIIENVGKGEPNNYVDANKQSG